MGDKKVQLAKIPPYLSDADQARVREIAEHMREIQQRYMKEVEPLIKLRAAIENKYPPRCIIASEDPLGLSDADKQALEGRTRALHAEAAGILKDRQKKLDK